MGNTVAPAVVQSQQSAGMKLPKPISGETRQYLGADGKVALTVKFDGKNITITKWHEPDVTRTIVPKYGNIRKVEGDIHTIADLALEYLFGLRSDN